MRAADGLAVIRAWLTAHKSLAATVVSGAAITALVTTLAVVSGGYSAQRLQIGDASVWVASDAKKSLGRANTEIGRLNSIVSGAGEALDVVQNGENVLLLDREANTVAVVDPATAEAGEPVALPPRSPQVLVAGGRVALLSQATGQLWLTSVGQLSTFAPGSAATMDLGGRAIAVMDPAGVLYTYQPGARTVTRVDLGGDQPATTIGVPASGDGANAQLTTAGGQWAVFDPDARALWLPGRKVELASLLGDSSGAVVQQPSGESTAVWIASSGGLLRVPLDGSAPRRVLTAVSGTPVAPAVSHGCAYAAWGSGTVFRSCSDDGPGQRSTIERPPGGGALVFRANWGRLLLNDTRSGVAWAVQNGNARIDNWDELVSQKNTKELVDQTRQDTTPHYEKREQPPVAVADRFGARPGRVTPLPVLLNDYDPNGDVLTIDSVTAVPESQGTLELTNADQQVQIALSATASGSIAFDYTISDGRGGTATAHVIVTVRGPADNSPPLCVRTAKAVVQAGGRVATPVLGDCYDPDGDSFFLAGATVPEPDTVTFTPQGQVAFSDHGLGGGVKDVSLVLSDGRAEGSGQLAVTVQPPGQVPIIADPFAVVTSQSQEVMVRPLDHVRGGNGTVRLSTVPSKADATITPDYQGGTFRFASDQPGAHTIEYSVTDGTETATGVIRIEVRPSLGAKTAPIAVPHTAFIREQSAQDVDVLSTDIDPSSGVLLVTSVSGPLPSTGIRVQVLQQRTLRVTLTRALAQPVDFHYRLSNGLADAEGTVTVVQLPALTVRQPPLAAPDSVAVRVDDVVDIPVLANDVQPDGGKLTLDPALATPLPSGAGLLFASGDHLRYLAPSKPGNYTAVYRVTGEDGQWATAEVGIAVRERDESANNPPVPKTVTARVLAGDTVRIAIPLSGIDPDGDSVQFVGQETNPQKGAVIASGPDWLDFRAGDYAAGTDSFTYAVVDALGARATGAVRVGIAPRAGGAHNPVAVEDDVTTRPGKTLSVQVLGNDSDPDGSPLSVTAVTSLDKRARAQTRGDIVVVAVPREAGAYGFLYTIQNDRGGTSQAFLRVMADKNAPPARPIVTDTTLELSDILGKDRVSVNVLSNVFFADGPVSSLKLSIVPGYGTSAETTGAGRIRVTIRAKSQVIPFSVANPEDGSYSAYGFVHVPGYDDALPQLRRGAPDLSVVSEKTLTIHLNDEIVAVGGRTVRLTDAATVRVTHSKGADPVVNSDTLQFTSANRYFGPASISFQVTDGSSATDPKGNVTTIVLPIDVTPRENQPPMFTGALIDFEPGQSKTIDLTKLTSYPYAKDLTELTYSVQEPRPAGVSLSLSGQKLTIGVAAGVEKGTKPDILIGVKDAVKTGQPGRIELTVVPSTRPLASPQPDRVIAPRGQTTTVDVLANDAATNPFPNQALRTIAVRGLGGSLPAGVTVTPSADSSVLAVAVASTAAPVDTTLQYEVMDATGDPERYTWGSVVISVQDRPSPVSNVRVAAIGDRSLTLSWIPGSFNNAPITGFEVTQTRAATGAIVSTTSCPTTVCVIPTPGNGPDDAVTLSVRARNALGLSDPTAYVEPVWSDVVPNAPTGLSASPLDHGLRISWTKPADAPGASPITSYAVTVGGLMSTVQVSGADAVGSPYSLNVTDPGIANGAALPFSVASRNGFYRGRTISNQSTGSAVPAGAPALTGVAPVATPDTTDGTSATLTWSSVFGQNGRAIGAYYAGVFQDGAPPNCSVTGVQTGNPVLHTDPVSGSFQRVTGAYATFTGLLPNHSYSFVVYADNGQGCTASAVVRATQRQQPGSVSSLQILGPAQNGATNTWDYSASVGYAPGSGSNPTVSYQLLSGGAVVDSGTLNGTKGVLSGTNGQHYGMDLTVRITSVCETSPDGSQLCTPQSASHSMGTAVSAAIDNPRYAPESRTFTWTGWPTGSGYDRVEYSCDGSTQREMPAPGQVAACTVPPGVELPALTIIVSANGGTYRYTTPASSMQ
ncbi:fibronectin-like protein [Leifsonia xyli subsp. cynodontis DSM 46306]|uniref:Fibronectin type-III domain-containing protein n=1 Tax=Leifsonia xyli subsp. cynodontis DSM 46306 TaxID=1389489 RepID=U3P916_LEIXC|nr:Ig-like domain-containing protein [Leifsonia xyli]AGW41397.1 fibronectin-like protein [Leifsonia xyli subsp. cynodontis DSM 46306]